MAGIVSAIKRFPLVSLWVILVFLASGLIINIIQLFLLLLWTINKTLYRWLNMHLVYLHWCQLTFLLEWWADVDLRLYGKEEDYKRMGTESAICVGNHRSDIDWLLGWVLADRAGVLGATKCYMKGYLKYLPIMGFAWSSVEYAFVSRNWQKDKHVLQNSLETLEDFPYPFWMAIFAEGTRLTEAKLQASIEYARSKNLPELKHHLLPRTKGFAITAQHFRNKVPAVYDMEAGYIEGKYPTLTGLLMGEKYEIHFLLRRSLVQDIPMDSLDDTSNWCREQFVEKDKVMSHYLEHGEFPAPRVQFPRHKINLLVFVAWHILLAFPLLSYILYVIFSGDLIILAVGALVTFICYAVLKVLLHFADSKKGSSFGLKSTSTVAFKKEQ